MQQGVGGFQFKKGEAYVFRYSFRARDSMKVSGSSTRFGQMKGVSSGFQLKGNPLFSITANNNGINVRFNNDDSDTVEGMDGYLSWENSVGEWVDVEVKTTFGKSMEVCVASTFTKVQYKVIVLKFRLSLVAGMYVSAHQVSWKVGRLLVSDKLLFTPGETPPSPPHYHRVRLLAGLLWTMSTHDSFNIFMFTGYILQVTFSGAVDGKAVWPSSYKPVAWNNDADSIMFKLGLYHIKNKVGT